MSSHDTEGIKVVMFNSQSAESTTRSIGTKSLKSM
jgi:hypothetical protein